jgi:hypothetical protein
LRDRIIGTLQVCQMSAKPSAAEGANLLISLERETGLEPATNSWKAATATE